MQNLTIHDERRTNEAGTGQVHVLSETDRCDALLRRRGKRGKETRNEMRDGRSCASLSFLLPDWPIRHVNRIHGAAAY